MKVLFHNRTPDYMGGDMVQMVNTMQELQKLGVEVNTTFNPACNLKGFDLVHIMHLNFDWTIQMARNCILQNKPYIISAIFYPHEYFVTFEGMRYLVDSSEFTIALSEAEKAEMVELLKCNPQKIKVICNGVDKRIFKPKKVKKEDRVIMVGRVVSGKGCHLLVEACKRLHLPLTLIGKDEGIEYSKQILPHVNHLEDLEPEEMAVEYSKSRVFVCPSLSERQSLAVLEAAACGLPVVDTIYNRGKDLLPSSIVVDPENIDELCQAIKDSWDKGKNQDKVPTWKDVAVEVKKLYEEVQSGL